MTEGTDREPDARFTLANERTYLAWIRTALAFVAGGIAVEELATSVSTPRLRTTLAVGAVGFGVVLALSAYRRWGAVNDALRRGEGIPPVRMVSVLTAGVVVIGLVALILVLS